MLDGTMHGSGAIFTLVGRFVAGVIAFRLLATVVVEALKMKRYLISSFSFAKRRNPFVESVRRGDILPKALASLFP